MNLLVFPLLVIVSEGIFINSSYFEDVFTSKIKFLCTP